jgi:hypothetical protein
MTPGWSEGEPGQAAEAFEARERVKFFYNKGYFRTIVLFWQGLGAEKFQSRRNEKIKVLI